MSKSIEIKVTKTPQSIVEKTKSAATNSGSEFVGNLTQVANFQEKVFQAYTKCILIKWL